MMVRIDSKRMSMWRAVGKEEEVLDTGQVSLTAITLPRIGRTWFKAILPTCRPELD